MPTMRPKTGSAYGPQRPTSVQAARGQMPQTMGFTGGLSKPINRPAEMKPKHKKPTLPKPTAKQPGYGATPAPTPIDSKIGYRGQEKAAYDGSSCGADGIKIKPSHKGLLHKDLGVPQGQKIPAAKVAAAKNSSSPAIRKRAVFAQNFGHDAAPVNKVQKSMHEFKHGELHSGSKTGPKVQNRKQAIAIGLSEQRKQDKE